MSYTTSFAPVNARQIALQQQNAHNPMATADGFSKAMEKVGLFSNMFGPALSTGLSASGLSKGAMITSAALSGVATPGGGMSAPGYGGGGGSPYVGWSSAPYSKKLDAGQLPSPPPGYPGSGGGGITPPPGYSGGGGSGVSGGGLTDVSAFDKQINDMMANNMTYLALQSKVQHAAQSVQMMSNIMKTEFDSRMAGIRNMRA